MIHIAAFEWPTRRIWSTRCAPAGSHLTAFPPGVLLESMGVMDGESLLRYLHCRYMGGDVKARVQRWGNSLAVRIPRAFADDLGLVDGAAVELTLEKARSRSVRHPRRPIGWWSCSTA